MKKKLDKACFQHSIVRRKASNKVLRDKPFNIAKNPKYDRYQCGHTSMVSKFFDKKSSADKSAKNLKSKKYTHLLKTTFTVLI